MSEDIWFRLSLLVFLFLLVITALLVWEAQGETNRLLRQQLRVMQEDTTCQDQASNNL